MQKAVFIDRDGVINSDVGHYYIYRPEDFKLNPGVGEGLKLLQDAGFLLIVITNQGGIARGVYTEKDVEATHCKMANLLAEYGVNLTEIYYCPHHDKVAPCDCRKPKPLNILKAIERFDIDKTKSWMIGDSEKDVLAGDAAGVNTRRLVKNANLLPVCKEIVAADKL